MIALHRAIAGVGLLGWAYCAALAAEPAGGPVDIGSRLELFVDRHLIERMDGTSLRLHEPATAETVLRFDRPYEGEFAAYVTLIQDGPTCRMYYRGLAASKAGLANHSIDSEVTCYAESTDGIRWSRPSLGLFEVAGSRDNNVILARNAACHNFSPFLDTRPGVEPAARYKALGGTGKGLLAFTSADGIHFRPLQDKPVITEGQFDSQNVGFWSAAEQCYVCYFRTWKKVGSDGCRWVSRTTSPDFVNWTAPREIDFGDAPPEHFYTNQTQPYYREPSLYVSLFARFMPGRQVVSTERARQLGVVGDYMRDCSDVCFMTSRGGNRFDRTFLESFVRPGPDPANWTSRTNYPALGLVPCGDRRMSFYVQRHYAQPSHCLQRLVLRVDGFASVNAPYRGGEMVTRPFVFSGRELVLNVATSAAGQVQVELQSPDGKALEGHRLADCDLIIGDDIDRVVTWKGRSDCAALAGTPVRLRAVMKDADLYAMVFRGK